MNSKHRGKIGLLGSVLVLALSSIASGQPAPEQARALGEQIATKGTATGAAPCASCHGQQGEGAAAGGFPRLAGQPMQYLAKQLTNYTDGSRNNPVMGPIAKQLTADEQRATATYYALLSAPAGQPAEAATPELLQRGEVLANRGDNERQVQACANCHGPGGAGEPPTFPYLAGQHASYTVNALTEWQNGNRNNDASQQMPSIAKNLSKDDATAVAAYFARQSPPSPKR